jgi:ribonuclease D
VSEGETREECPKEVSAHVLSRLSAVATPALNLIGYVDHSTDNGRAFLNIVYVVQHACMFWRRLSGMTDPELKATILKKAVNQSNGETARWPLSFRIPPGSQHQSQQGLAAFGVTSTKQKPKKTWWSHQLYRGPNDEQVKIQYSKTKADSEVLAKQFLDEKVVGFDMEWPWNDWKLEKLQNKIGLIQVATEDKIALFHIGLHVGKTTDDIIAPSLRKLIESPAIGKIGVGILTADFARLRRYFKLQPKGAVELSHLHRLVTFGGRKPELVSTKMTSLAHQVEQHLDHPLYKGDVRTSNWSKPLSQEQIKYAAGDAYAGIMLYHCLNYKRLQMDPVPPMPIHAEKYLGFKLAGVGSLYLEPAEEGGKLMTSAFFFGVPTALENLSKSKKAGAVSKTPKSTGRTKPTTTDSQTNVPVKTRRVVELDASHLDATSLALYHELRDWRTEGKHRLSDAILIRLAEQRPLTVEALIGVQGVGKMTQKSCGKAIVGVILSFMTKNNMDIPESVVLASSETAAATSNSTLDAAVLPSTPTHSPRRAGNMQSSTPDSSPAFGTPPALRTRELHTGLSFTLAETRIAETLDSDSSSDSSLPSLDFNPRASQRRTSGQKRKRSDSPTKKPAPTAPPACTPAPVPAPLTPRSRILHSKLTAFSKLIAAKNNTQAARLVSSATLEAMARNPPTTRDELRRVPGVEPLFLACVDADMDLLSRIQRFAGV